MLVAMVLLNFAHAETIVVNHGNREKKKVAITIDDCYDRKHIEAAVTLCQKHEIPITFFPIGNALKYADGPLWQSALDAKKKSLYSRNFSRKPLLNK